jgi:hypothetical protein
MGQHDHELATDGQSDGEQLQMRMQELRLTIRRLHALFPQYHQLADTARSTMEDSHLLRQDINRLARNLGLPSIPQGENNPSPRE